MSDSPGFAIRGRSLRFYQVQRTIATETKLYDKVLRCLTIKEDSKNLHFFHSSSSKNEKTNVSGLYAVKRMATVKKSVKTILHG